MKKYLDKILKYSKAIFLICVSILIIAEFSKIKKEISFQELNGIISSLGIFNMFILFVFGVLAVMPMINYDFIFNKMIQSDKDRAYIFPRSMTVNTFNNLIGFGGLINIGLRMQYFAEGKEKKWAMQLLIKFFLFTFTGCSFLSLIGLVNVFAGGSSLLQKYIPWLIGGVFYYPLALWMSKYKDKEENNFSKRVFFELSITSILEWGLSLLFFVLVGRFLGIHLGLTDILTVYITATLVGLLSMIPGGLGSFDLMALTSFTMMGLDSEIVLSWLMLFRLFYYIIPFIIGAFFFIKNAGQSFNQKKEGIPLQIFKSLGLDFFSVMMYLLGIIFIVSASVPDETIKIQWLSGFDNIHGNIIYQFPSVMLGCLYILLGRAIKNKVARAYKPCLTLLAVGLIYALLSDFGIFMIVYFIVAIIVLKDIKQGLTTLQLVYSFEDITEDLLVFSLTAVATIVLGTQNYSGYSLIKRVEEFALLPHENNLFLIALGILLIALAYFSLLHHLKGEQYKLGVAPDFDEIKRLTNIHINSTEASLAYVGDKDIYYFEDENHEKRCALQIYTIRDRVIVMGEPFGDQKYYQNLTESFIKEAALYGYSPIFYEISAESTMKLHDYGFSFMKFGESGYVDLESFNLHGSDKRGLRNVINKFNKNNMTFEVLTPPYSDVVMKQLKEISDKWLAGRAEKGFSLGFFREDYLQRCSVAVCKNADSEIIAFANIMPTGSEDWATIDLMRFDNETAPNGTMDYLFMNIFLYLKDKGFKYFNLGMAPLSNVGINKNSFIQEKLAFLIYTLSDRFYSFKGLRAYKQKFASDWKPLYVSFSRKSWLLYTIISLFWADLSASKKSD